MADYSTKDAVDFAVDGKSQDFKKIRKLTYSDFIEEILRGFKEKFKKAKQKSNSWFDN